MTQFHGPDLWDGQRPLSQRLVLSRKTAHSQGMSLLLAAEDVSSPTDWCFEDGSHRIVVHLDGVLDRMESVFSRGPSTDATPSNGDIWAIPAGVRYAALAHGTEVRFAEFSIAAEHAKGELKAGVGLREPFLHQATLRAAALLQRADDLATMALKALLPAIELHLRDVFLMPGAAHRIEQAGTRQQRFSQRQRDAVRQRIHDTSEQALTIEELANGLGLSSSHFMALFSNSFGMSPWQYVLKVRLSKVRIMLASSSRSVTEIALATGFSTPSHMSASFRRHFGLTPVAYRRLREGSRPKSR